MISTHVLRSPFTFVSALVLASLTAGCGPLDGDAPAGAALDPEIATTTSPLLVQTGRRVSVGANHTCAILERGEMKCWGGNASGQLLQGNTIARGDNAGEMGDALPYLTSITGGRYVTQIASGDHSSCALLDNGTVKCWGHNFSGQLGMGDTTYRGDNVGEAGTILPVPLGTGRTAKFITAGAIHYCAILDNNTVKCWGGNSDGQLGLGDTNNRGDVANEMGDNLLTVPLGTGRTAKWVGGGRAHTCAILDNNTVKCWGWNPTGATGAGTVASRGDGPGEMGDALPIVSLGTGRTAKAMAVGYQNSCVILDNDALKCWGEGSDGELGQGDAVTRGDQPGELGDALPAINLGTGRKATQVAVNAGTVCALLDNLTVKCWGWNAGGNLGLGDTQHRGDQPGEMGDALPALSFGAGLTPASLADADQGESMCVTFTNGRLKCWGGNDIGQLGLGDTNNRGDAPGEMGSALPFVSLGTKRGVAHVSTAWNHTCAVLTSGELKCWGSGVNGVTGLGDTSLRGDAAGEMGNTLPIVNVGTGRTVKQVSANIDNTCVVLDNNTAKCWGYGFTGTNGQGNQNVIGDGPGEMGDALPAINLGTGRTVKTIGVGGDFACALLDNNTVKCWGYNVDGLLGQGHTTSLGDGPGEMGDALPAVNVGTGRTVKQLAVGGAHVCVLLDNDTVKCWGSNGWGQLGQGNTQHRGDGPGEMGDAMPVVNLGTGRTAKQVIASAVGSSTCAILDNNKLKCWGANWYGILGLGDGNTRGDGAGEMGDALPYVDLGAGRTVVAASVGHMAACALRDDGALVCWGNSDFGTLGTHNTLPRGDGPGEMGGSLVPVILNTTVPVAPPLSTATPTISAGAHTVCATFATGQLKCWGKNTDGMCGIGNATPQGDAPPEMYNLPFVDLGTE